MYTENIGEALQKKPDVAIVLVNSPAHQLVIEQCHLAGIRKIFVEKPLVYTLDELEALNKLDLKTLYTGYLINFSGVVNDLFQFIKKEELIVVQARS